MPTTTLEDVLASSEERSIDRFSQYINPEFASMLATLGLDKTFVEARDATVVDRAGEEYLDFLGGYGSLNLGHNPPEVLEAVDRVAERPNFQQASIRAVAAGLGEALAEITPGDLEKSFFCNSGSEAVEGALKLARISTGRGKVLSTDGAYHGSTFGALSASGSEKYRTPFAPLVPGFERVPYGDLEALESELASEEYAAFVVEPIQGEAGIVVPPEGYLTEAERICRETGTLLVVDEVQTGLGRTGELFACQRENVEPDIMTLAKSLGGGVAPLGAYIATDEVWAGGYGSPEKAILHASTFANNTRACAAGLKALELVVERDLPERAARLGERFRSDLAAVADEHEMIETVRGEGLLVGLEFYEPMVGKSYSEEYLSSLFGAVLMRDHNVITAYTANNPNVLRLEPPLTVERAQLDRVVDAVDEVCTEHGGFLSIAKSVAGTRLAERIGLS